MMRGVLIGRYVQLAFISLLWTGFSFAQNLDKIGKEDMLRVNGGLGYNMIGNSGSQQDQGRPPFSWVLQGNLNVSLIDFSMPITFSFTNAGFNYTQPFNMLAIHPTYKWVKTHIGITSMNLSPYTYSGLNFAGAGFELTPKNWNIKAFGGRIKKAIEYDPLVDNLGTVSYRRMAYGLSVGYKFKKVGATLIALKAKDDPNSLSFFTPNAELAPMDNLVLSGQIKATIFKSLQFSADYARTFLTQNIRSGDGAENQIETPLLVQNNSTIQRNAYNASIDYRYKFLGIGAKYERVDPGYQTLGALFFNNDLENITITPTLVLFKNKLNIAANTGFQRNNLTQIQATNNQRWVGNITLTAQLSKGMTLNANYSNFSSFSRRNPAADPFYNTFADTMNLFQINENFVVGWNYSFGDSLRQTLNANFNYNQSQNITGRLHDAAAFGFNLGTAGSQQVVDVYTVLFSHSFAFVRSKFSLGYMFNFNQTLLLGARTAFLGPGLNASKPLLKGKMNVHLGGNYNRQWMNSALASHIMNWRCGLSANPEVFDKKYGKITCALNVQYTQRFAVLENQNGSSNLTIIANLNYSF